MSDALPAGSTLADAVAMPRVDGASRAVLVGLSGGLDSVVLLHLLCTQPGIRDAGLRAIHVHHGLQSAADDWASHCRALCEALDVPLQVVRSEEHTSELQSLMRISYAVFCLKKKIVNF